MSAEITEVGETFFHPFGSFEEEAFGMWNGRQVTAARDLGIPKLAQSKIDSFDNIQNRTLAQTVTRASPAPKLSV